MGFQYLKKKHENNWDGLAPSLNRECKAYLVLKATEYQANKKPIYKR